jgi:phosphate:Na+ symporter
VTATLFQLAGGIGLFLMGMVLLSDGLKSFAGDALRRSLLRLTGQPGKAFASGALVTALVQSSSATTVAVIGFVSAGLLTFAQAVGVVMGASLGTTATSWLVAVLGLKVSVGFYALPLVGAGAFFKLMARGRWKSFGTALAGFGLIFLGIETLQRGMEGVAGVFDLAALPSRGFFGHLLMVLLGAAMTVVMQSSSAAVATVLTALHTATVNFEQAAALVIGAAIGTTVTGALAAIGATIPAKRTALAHVLFNLAAGGIALLLLPLFLYGIVWAQEDLGLDPGPTSLAAFHTAFILVGVAIFLPLAGRFAAWIERLLPESGPVLTRHLDESVLHLPAVALEATRGVLRETACVLLAEVRAQLTTRADDPDPERRVQLHQALEETQAFFSRIPPVDEGAPMADSREAQIHAIDHMVRLLGHSHLPPAMKRVMGHERLQAPLAEVREALQLAELGLQGRGPEDWLQKVQQATHGLAERQRQERPAVLRQTATGRWDPATALDVLDALRWLARVTHHAFRISHYLGREGRSEVLPPEDEGHE